MTAQQAREPAVDPAYPDLDAVLAKNPGENFPVALKVIPARYRRHLMAVYAFARFVDDVGDETDASPAQRERMLDEIDADIDRIAGGEPALPALRMLAPTARECGMPAAPLHDLVAANRLDQHKSRYATFDELREYCRLSADPVGRLVLHAFGAATPERIALSDQVCTALQLAEHWQDVAEDFARDRIYLPQDDMARFGVTDAHLRQPHAGRALKALLAFEVRRARQWIDAGAPLVGTLSGRGNRWARLAVAGYVAGGKAALAAISRADFDVMPGAPKASRGAIARRTVSVALRGH